MQKSINIKWIFSQSWGIYKRHFFAITIIYFAIFLILAFVRQLAPEALHLTKDAEPLFKLFSFFVQSFFALGIIYMVLKIDKNRAPTLNDFFANLNRFFSFALLLFVISLLFYTGLYFLIVPGFLVLLLFAFAPYAFVDKGFGVLKSLLYSFHVGKGHWYKLTIFWFLIFTMNFVASLLLLPALIVVPFSSIALARLYLSLSCLHERKNLQECETETSGNSLWIKVFSLIFVFVLSFYGADVFFKKYSMPALEHSIDKQDMQNLVTTPDPEIVQEFDRILLAIQLYKDDNARCPSIVDIENITGEPFDARFLYTTDKNVCTICIMEKNICKSI